ncbi:translation elongation factor Ts [Patescibacteria group bacterium]|nr:translation elongation factor Ts [Patescibacteria group bacterium]MBU2579872.1 translation elongation factor Ts [Patescibacteria group bacterium]MBU4030869.1 translation elongation factor Ts [Patescibacteria group bacterium]MBU4082903.1 translation elongation factor Ts [Patescibacteria group bacterium]MCG2809020.1 translation elongation factor Ts [Candidatus Portnoybacteria bacterium]
MISMEQIKQLREETNVSVMECKNALEEAGGDMKKALEILKEKGKAKALKKAGREAKQGLVEAYIHNNGKIGVVLELNCETDFVARNEDFKALAHDIAMHIAAIAPKDKEELLQQPFIKDEKQKIEDLINGAIAKLGENIRIGEFSRLEI